MCVCVCVCVCACVRACVRACVNTLRIVSVDKMLCFSSIKISLNRSVEITIHCSIKIDGSLDKEMSESEPWRGNDGAKKRGLE